VSAPHGRAVTDAYSERAALLNDHLCSASRRTIANWFHFAAWGTYNVNWMAEVADPQTREVLYEAQQLMFNDVEPAFQRFMNYKSPERGEVGDAFRLYDAVRSDPYSPEQVTLMRLANMILATHEQMVIDAHLHRAFDDIDPQLADLMRLVLPDGEQLTPPQPWQEFRVRMPWINAVMHDYISDERLLENPYAA
jgi:hypothetical protein